MVSFLITRRFCSSFTSITALSSWKWYPELAASCFSADTSLLKQEPPQPSPACRNFGPIRSSRPTPRATSRTSAPTSSQTLAISLTKEIFAARKAFDASLIISALVTSVSTSSPPSGS